MVAAPTARSSPRAKAGLSKFEASIAPSAAPAPIIIWISSIKRIRRPPEFLISFIKVLSRSSNSPLNFVPAIKEPKSKAIISFPFKVSGISPETILWAKPSIMAVLPTPGSPIKTGLFLVRRERIWITLLNSSSLPIKGSSFPWRAFSVRFSEYFSKARNLDSGISSVTLILPRNSAKMRKAISRRKPNFSKMVFAGEVISKTPISKCSQETNSSLLNLANFAAASITWMTSEER